MKKLIAILLVVMTAFSCVSAFAESIPEVYVDDTKVEFDVEPMYVDGVLMLPVRFICESMKNTSVVWNADTESVIIVTVSENGEQSVVMIQLGNDKMFMLDNAMDLEKAPFEIDGRTLISLDFFENAFPAYTAMLYEGNVIIKSAF